MARPRPFSESQAWDAVDEIAGVLLGRREAWVQEYARELKAIAAEMRGQLRQGVHANPPLVVYGNPPMSVRRRWKAGQPAAVELVDVMSVDVHEIRYTHTEDGKDYRHEFQPRAAIMSAALAGQERAHVLWIEGARGLPLWKDL